MLTVVVVVVVLVPVVAVVEVVVTGDPVFRGYLIPLDGQSLLSGES